ncbi:hypothetical protein CA13_49020 [Planctomycetes bacterium CA13]|uniref:SHOCT domain-containing protein n=1 Tax=Novipirellula herctigrandis TaxID=2527986 RepID=A0A5C5Z8J9_9BACT|nr:hypothetical protein CA13_49020 [Planctomycetes bacterium CA13]
MTDFFSNPTIQAGLSVLVLCVLIAVAFSLVSKFRDYNANDRETASDTLANLREIHLRGDIDDQEYRMIEATTHRQLANANHENSPSSQTPSAPNPQTPHDDSNS